MDESSSKSIKFRTNNLTYRALQQAVVLIVVYVFLLFLLPSGKDTIHAYNLTMFEYHVICFAIALPSLLVCLAAFEGYSKLRRYAHSLRKTPEGEHFDR